MERAAAITKKSLEPMQMPRPANTNICETTRRDFLGTLTLATAAVLIGQQGLEAGEEGRRGAKPKAKSNTEKGTIKAVKPVKPPEVKKGEPIAYKTANYDVEEWKKKTKINAAPWFTIDGDRWFVDWDAERKPLDTIVIHHSATGPDATANDIDRIQKDRLYVPRYNSNNDDPFIRGLPVHSGHVIDGRERFIAYHHLVYPDGKVTTELSPLVKIDEKWCLDHVGWHSGKWSVNCKSLGICCIDDFSEKEPTDVQLRAIAGLIVHYRTFAKATVTGHGDHARTECPGKTWHSWRAKLLTLAGISD